MSDCNHDCASCKSKCSTPDSLIEKTHEGSRIKKVIAVVSGKGGVGKSLVTGLLASRMMKEGAKCAVIDADITGPSVPRMFGVKGMLMGDEKGVIPSESKRGVKIVSSNLMLESETDPIIWRGPIIAGMVKQFWTDVIWGDVDYMFVDCPPGTGDVPLTVFQSIKVDGIIIVTSPQELVSMIVAKAVKMANLMNVPVIGLVENMSYLKCPDCGKEIDIFGSSKVNEIALSYGIKLLAKLPIDPAIARSVDAGEIESIDTPYLDEAVEELKKI